MTGIGPLGDGPQADAAARAEAERLIGTELGGYRIGPPLGRGGMGVVFRAHDLALDRDVALKLLVPDLAADTRFRERFLRESRLAASLDHPAIVPIYDAGEVAGQLYIAMRLVEGSDLKRLLAEERRLDPERALRLLEQVADALDAAHERGLVHRDVKPSNVLVDERGHCYLADFGLSRRLADQAAGLGDGRSLGTVDYVAPEQIRGEELDGRADLYSLGCLLYECLSGRPPFAGRSDTAVVFAHLEEPPPPLAGLEAVIGKALAKEPDDRYQSGRELVAAARVALGLGPPRRSRWPLTAAAGLAAVAAGLLGVFLTRGGPAPVAVSQPEPGADTLIHISAATNTIDSTMRVAREARAVAADGQRVWVTSAGDGTVWRIDALTGETLRIPVGGSPTGVAAGEDAVLVADGSNGTVTSLDPASGAVGTVTRLATAEGASLLVASGPAGQVYADSTSGLVARLLPSGSSGETVGGTLIPPDTASFLTLYRAFDGLAVGADQAWVAGDPFGRTAWRVAPKSLDTGSNPVGSPVELPFAPGALAVSSEPDGSAAVWVTSLLDDVVARIDPKTDQIVATLELPAGVNAIAAGAGGVWVTSSVAQIVSRIDPRTNQVVAAVPLTGTPTAVATGDDGVWVTTAEPQPAPPAGSIGIGVIADCRGRSGGLYASSIAGAELALLDRGARLSRDGVTDGVIGAELGGQPVSLELGCADGTAASALLEARRLVEQRGARILIGPTSAAEELALLEYARRRPDVVFVNGTAAAQILDPPANFFSFMPDAAQNMAGLGTYAYRVLGWRNAVLVGDLDGVDFNWAQTAGFAAEFCALGGSIVDRAWVPPGTSDYSELLDGLPDGGVDGVVAAAGGETALAIAEGYPFVRESPSGRLIVGSAARASARVDLFRQRNPGLAAGTFPDPKEPNDLGYLTDFAAQFPELAPGGIWDYAYFRAMDAIATALTATGGDASASSLSPAVADVSLDSPTGAVSLDGEGAAVVASVSAGTALNGVEHTFGGYFTASDQPPGPTTPACRSAAPAPWTEAVRAPAPPPAQGQEAAITPASIAGAELGLAADDYRVRLGEPALFERAKGGDFALPDFEQPADYSRLTFPDRELSVFFQGLGLGTDPAIQISTWNEAYRTAEGVGPCSTAAELKAAYGDRLKPDPGGPAAYIVGRTLIFVMDSSLSRVAAVSLYDGTGPGWDEPGGPLFTATFVGSQPDTPACG